MLWSKDLLESDLVETLKSINIERNDETSENVSAIGNSDNESEKCDSWTRWDSDAEYF